MNGEQPTLYSDKDSVFRRILEESPISNTTFSAKTDVVDDDSHKHYRVKSTKTPYKRRSRKDKDKDGKSYPVGARDVARLLLNDEREALHMKKLLEKTAERLEIESRRALEAEKRARDAELRMVEVLSATRDTQRELLHDRELLRAFQTQVDTARGEILKAQKELDSLAEEKYKVEEEAAKERSRYRQLQKEVEVKQALEKGRLEGFVDGRKEGWHLGKEFARGHNRIWRDAEYYSEGDESASIFSSNDTTGPPPLTNPPFEPSRPAVQTGQAGQSTISMPVPEIRTDLPVPKTIPRSMTPHSHRRVASAMQSPKSRTSGKSHRRSSLGVAMPVPNPAPAAGPGPSGLRQNTLSTEDDMSTKSPARAFSTKTPLRPPSVRAGSTRPDAPLRGRTPVDTAPVPSSPRFPQPTQSPRLDQPSQPTLLFDPTASQEPPPIRPTLSPRPRTPSHSPIDPLPGGYIPVLDENGRISLPPPHEVDPYPPSPSALQNNLTEDIHHASRQHTPSQQPQRQPPTLNINLNVSGTAPAGFDPQIQPEQPSYSINFPVPDPVPPPTQEFSIPVPNITPRQSSPIQLNDQSFIYPSLPSIRRSPAPSERRSSRTPVGNYPIHLTDEINDLNIAEQLFETDENGRIPGTEGYVHPRGSGFRPLSAIPEGGSTTAESPRFASRNASAASFRGPKFSHAGSSMLNKPHPPIPPKSPSMGRHSPISPHNSFPDVNLFNGQGIYDDPREYAELTDLPNTLVTQSRQQLADHLRPAPSDVEQILDDVSIRTSTSRASARDRIDRRFQSRDVEHLEKQAEMYVNFGSGQPYPFNSSDSSRDSPQTFRATRTPAPRRSPSVPNVTLMEPSPPEARARNRPASRTSSRRHSVASIRSVDDGVAPFIPPSPSQFQPANPITHDYRIVKNSPPPGFMPMPMKTPSVAPQSRVPTVTRVPVTLPDRTPAAGGSNVFPPTNTGIGFGMTPHRVALPYSVSSTVRNLPGGTQGAPSVRATPARLPMNVNSATTTTKRLPTTLPSRGTGRTVPSELPPMGANFGSTSNPPAGFVPQPSPAMSAAMFGISGATPQMGQGTFMGRTPASASVPVPNAANFSTGTVREVAPLSTSKEPARLPGSRRPSISASATGKTPARLPTTFMGGESSQRMQMQPPFQATPAQPFQGHSPFGFGNWTGGPPGFVGAAEPNAFKATPASGFKTMSNARPPARLPDRNSTINTPARLPLPQSNTNTPWTTGPPLTNSRPYGTLPTPASDRQAFIPPSPYSSAAPTSARMGVGLPMGGSHGGSHRGSPVRSSSPFHKFDSSTYVDPSTILIPPSRPASRAGSARSAHGTNMGAPSSYLVPPGAQVTEYGRVTIESASDEDD